MGSLAVFKSRPHPQWTCVDTSIEVDSFFGKIRTIYASAVLKTQLEQLKRSGCYDMFSGDWMPCYDTRRIHGAKALTNGLPPSLFWESDIGKWIESASYFLGSPESGVSRHAKEFSQAIEKLIGEMEALQQPDGYLNVYFTIVDPEGRFQNLRDMHEMYNAGHLLEGALAHYRTTGSSRFLNIMIKNVECFMKAFGPHENQRPVYPGHPEFELAVLRLYAVTQDPRHLAFAEHMLSARGTSPPTCDGQRFFMWEAEQRKDEVYGCWMKRKDDLEYHQSHEPLHQQEAILGHSVRAMYLLTACADLGGDFLDDAKRLWDNAVEKKMYITGGFGSEPQSEGFSELDFYLPLTTGEGGCYAETCASIAAMMVAERILSHELNGRYRDILELCLYNAVLGGGSLDGKGFSYANKMATYGVCCCPPNLSRTIGILPGYIWAIDDSNTNINVTVYVYSTARHTVISPTTGEKIEISMQSEMPWAGHVAVKIESPISTGIVLRLPVASWMVRPKFSWATRTCAPGYVETILDRANPQVDISFGLETRLVYPNPRVNQDTLSVMRGPIVFVAEDVDNSILEESHPHFELVALGEDAKFTESRTTVADIPILKLTTTSVYTLAEEVEQDVNQQFGCTASPLWKTVHADRPVRTWTRAWQPLRFVPWFARGNRGGKGHLRVPFKRVGRDHVVEGV